uniref:hypothetical protein n=1 Tax=uncultured Maribacter sp. TaxID=431308 RepID=UPI0026189F6F
AASTDDQTDEEVLLATPSDYDNDATTPENNVQQALNAIAAASTDNQTATQVPVTLAATNYTAATQNVEAHLVGINTAIGNNSISGTTGSIFFANGLGRPSENNNQLFWDNTNNVFGIGTNSPDTSGTIRLHINGTTRSGGFITSDGSSNTPSYRFNSDDDTGMFWGGAADELGFSVGGVEALRIRDEGTTDSELVVNGSIELTEQLLDENGNSGNVDDILTATGTGTEWKEPTVVAMGKANGGNSIKRKGVTIGGSALTDTIRVTFDNPRPDNDYTIQLTVLGDNRIYVKAQTTNYFDITIKENSTGNFVVANWYFTILDF